MTPPDAHLEKLMDEIQVATQIAVTFRDSPDATLRAQGIETHSRQEGLDRLAAARTALREYLSERTLTENPRRLQEIFTHDCVTGDYCPHETQSECDKALAEFVREMESE